MTMPLRETVQPSTVAVVPGMTIRAAAKLMRDHHVDVLTVIDQERAPIGRLTDWDIVSAIVALELNPDVFLVGDLLDDGAPGAHAES